MPSGALHCTKQINEESDMPVDGSPGVGGGGNPAAELGKILDEANKKFIEIQKAISEKKPVEDAAKTFRPGG
jgi:hypothetical protein